MDFKEKNSQDFPGSGIPRSPVVFPGLRTITILDCKLYNTNTNYLFEREKKKLLFCSCLASILHLRNAHLISTQQLSSVHKLDINDIRFSVLFPWEYDKHRRGHPHPQETRFKISVRLLLL